jgi:cytochrome c oxidase assembly protein subunit 15
MTHASRIVVVWLSVVCTTIFAMIVVGGITRLTESGLSMVDWRPIMGAMPPITDEEWNATFEAYKQFPQYREVNVGMDLEGFKEIFYWEYVHRLLGRLIGVIFFIPFVVLWWRGYIAERQRPWLIVALVLGGLQGLLGWYMVQSGLIDMPRVSHYRLAAHLLLAMFIFGYLFWIILDIREVERTEVTVAFRSLLLFLSACIFVQLLYGAFTAGSRAGYGYNTFPLMNESWIAEAVFYMEPWWMNLFESTATIQFIHRWLGALVVVLSLGTWWAARRWGPRVKWSAAALAATLMIQFGIGVVTLVEVVEIRVASLHQAWACAVLLALVYLLYVSRNSNRS